ncbi:sulfotransferase family protein [Rhodopirellula sp. JC740]|uniref:Sulfotransferase family protein n=1 Tax=Rhodopirellula halodulae TaxID=2894198 RepID=A0ABS8NDF9_9BACT|nr:sulfotransferase family 2 domain-containing protein [Rhodopirellula sp. JC740]MCC9640873.1 sulfotransferase family protein [Rhodopirellula sp. JC740]
MTIDRGRNLLFVHIPKNAGKAVEVALGMITEREASGYRFRSIGNRFATYIQRASSDALVAKRLFGTLDYTVTAQHLTLQEMLLLGLVEESKLPKLFSAAVVRNPWDRAISTYAHLNGRLGTSDDFVRFWKDASMLSGPDHNIRAHLRPQISFLRDCEGRIAVRKILRFESLSVDFERMLKPYARAELSVIGRRNCKINHRDYLSRDAKKLVEKIFEADIEHFKYCF